MCMYCLYFACYHNSINMMNYTEKYEKNEVVTSPGEIEKIRERYINRRISHNVKNEIGIRTTQDCLIYEFQLKEYDEKDVICKIDVFGNLVIRGHRTKRSNEMQQSSSAEESKENEFLFEIKIPEGVNTDSMTTNIEEGILTISLLFKSTKDKDSYERYRERERESEREREKEEQTRRERSLERQRERERERERERREAERLREKEREEEKLRERERYWESHSHGDRGRESERGREREKEWTSKFKTWHQN